MKDTSLKQYYDTVLRKTDSNGLGEIHPDRTDEITVTEENHTMLQKNDSSGEGKRCPDHTDEITVTQAPEYGSPAERENGKQETLKGIYTR